MVLIAAANYSWYLFGFLLSQNVHLGATYLSTSLRVSLSHKGLFFEVEGSPGGGSMGSIGSSILGIRSSVGDSSCFLAPSSWSLLGIGRSQTFPRVESSSKVTSRLISTSL